MTIKTIEYRELRTHNYENTTIGYTADLDGGERESDALDVLRASIDAEFVRVQAERDQMREGVRELRSIEYQRRDSQNLLDQLQEGIKEKMAVLGHLDEFFSKHGLDFSAVVGNPYAATATHDIFLENWDVMKQRALETGEHGYFHPDYDGPIDGSIDAPIYDPDGQHDTDTSDPFANE